MALQILQLGSTNIPLSGIGGYTGQQGSYPLNNTRQGQQKMWMRSDANPATQGQIRNMSSFQTKTFACIQGASTNTINVPIGVGGSVNVQSSQLKGTAGISGGINGLQPKDGGAGGNALNFQTQPGISYALFQPTVQIIGGGGGGGAGALYDGGSNGGNGGAGGSAVTVQGVGQIVWQGIIQGSGTPLLAGGGGGGGGGYQATAPPTRTIYTGGAGGGGAGLGAGGRTPAGTYASSGTDTTGGAGTISPRPGGVLGFGGAGGASAIAGQQGSSGQDPLASPINTVNGIGGAGGAANPAAFRPG